MAGDENITDDNYLLVRNNQLKLEVLHWGGGKEWGSGIILKYKLLIFTFPQQLARTWLPALTFSASILWLRFQFTTSPTLVSVT